MRGSTVTDPIHPEGIYECNGCGRTYAEYVNGCLEDHDPPRSVRLVVADPPFITNVGTGMTPAPTEAWTPVDTDEMDRVRRRGAGDAQSAHFHHRPRGGSQ